MDAGLLYKADGEKFPALFELTKKNSKKWFKGSSILLTEHFVL